MCILFGNTSLFFSPIATYLASDVQASPSFSEQSFQERLYHEQPWKMGPPYTAKGRFAYSL